MLRTHTCGELNIKNKGQKVTLCGWIASRRDHGGVIFLDLRDRYGKTQVVARPEKKEIFKIADSCRSEFVVKVKGKVVARPKNMINKKLITGEIEVEIDAIEILSKAKTPPFDVDFNQKVSEEIRLKYRYVDLRRTRLQRNFYFRHRVLKYTFDFFHKNGFIYIETPFLGKSTPEGARDFLVPSRFYPGKFYALPQSPQQYKQLLMIAGFDKYFQIVKCLRDEDLRENRQPEFTQVDIEMSFCEQDDIMKINEEYFTGLVESLTSKKLLIKPFKKLTYAEVMEKYGTDKPDLRFAMELADITEIVKNCKFKVFKEAIKEKREVRGFCVSGGAKFSRKEIQELVDFSINNGARGLAWLALRNRRVESPIAKFFSNYEINGLVSEMKAKENDLLVFIADKKEKALNVLGKLRIFAAEKLKLRNPNILACAWVYDFPMFEWNEKEEKWDAKHHPFTRPRDEDIEKMEKGKLAEVKSYAYDLVCNGEEIAGGSIRIHDKNLQDLVFKTLGLTEDKVKSRFGHFLTAYDFGVPPHGGIAFGLDRNLMLLLDEKSIREVIAFPKTQKGEDLMIRAPDIVEDRQLKELKIKIEK